jgi:hypothetical protein
MRFVVCLVLSGIVLAGCARSRSKQTPAQFGSLTEATAPIGSANPNSKLIITPETSFVGKVVQVNNNARFAILNFPLGIMPGADQRLNVYRRGLKVGEVKVTGPRQDDNTVADITNGEVQAGDDLRGD